MDLLVYFGYYLLALLAGVIIFYLCGRAASVAYFRTKLEYLRSVVKEGRDGNGK